jgi:cyclopropane-fatty-acyl-phospholipid synthase
MERIVKRILAGLVQRGNLQVRLPSGDSFTAGDGTGEPVAIAFTSRRALIRCLLDPELRLGEAYMDGTLRVERGSITQFLDLVLSQTPRLPPVLGAQVLAGVRYLLRRIAQFNPRLRARRNVQHHYDLDGRLYSIFLDADRQYSCAYFEHPGMSLDDAQLAKRRHLAAKLLLEKPNMRVLDIGSGWGGLAIYLAEVCGARVLGCTLSDEQFVVSRQRARERGLQDKVQFELEDYRDLDGEFDRIVSVGMFEHVGVGYYDAFFAKVRDLLAPNGVAVLHSIGRSDRPAATNPWIAKYIFPGGYIPALSEVLPAIERKGLVATDIEILRLHYAETLKAWRERFLARREDVLRFYDQRFCRMWEFYLAASEMAFRHQHIMVFQIQLARKQEAVPLTRDYLMAAEERLRAAERAARPPVRLAGE